MSGDFGYIDSDNRKIPRLQFQNVRATLTGRSLRTIGVRVRANTSDEHVLPLTTVRGGVKDFSLTFLCVPKHSNYKVVCQKVAALLQEERERKGMSMTVLGERAGISQQSVSYIERGLRIPNLDTLFRLADALGIELSTLIGQATKRNP